MNTHINSSNAAFNPRTYLADVSRGLLAVHESLVAAVRVSFEKLHGRVESNGTLLELVLHDPLFAWLRPLSSLVAELDGLLDDEDACLEAAKLAELRTRIERLISASGEPDDFADSYRVFLQSDPAVVMAHAALKRELDALPRQSTEYRFRN